MQSTLFSFPCWCTRPLVSISQPRNYSISCSSENQSHANPNPNPNEAGDYKCRKKEMTALQKHAAFFDRNNDGVIYPWETFEGVVAIGFNPILAFFGAIPTNIALSFLTRPWELPDPFFPIEVNNIDKAQHGSDTGVYNNGRFDKNKFEDIFIKHARTDTKSLTHEELMGMLAANREPFDIIGWIGAYAEWESLYVLCKNKKGKLEKETVRALYDGSLFQKLEMDHMKKLEDDRC